MLVNKTPQSTVVKDRIFLKYNCLDGKKQGMIKFTI